MKSWKTLIIALPLALALITCDAKTWSAEKDTAKPAVKKKRAAAKGRLPNYYRTVVNETQKNEIYSIQKKYAEQSKDLQKKIIEVRTQLKDLQKQIAKVKAQRDAETEALLTPEQKDKIAKLAASAKNKRKKPSSKNKKSASTAKPGKAVAGK